jgi:uncharacterized protein (TIGR04255 family)
LSTLGSSSPPHDLVHFARPPLAEVALTAQFAAPVVDVEVLAAFRTAVKRDLPRSEQHPVLPPMTESFDLAQQVPAFEIRFDTQAGLPRSWFISADGLRLVQLQSDRLTLNWRRLEASAPYPRYAVLREDVERYLELLLECAHEAERPAPEINLVELTYVNHVELPEATPSSHPDLARVINRVRSSPDRAFLGKPEDAQFHARWRIPEVERPAGRLYVSAAPVLRPDGPMPIYVVNVMGRVLPTEGNPEAAMAALDLAHEWVVLGFVDLTTAEMHDVWELQRS